MSCSESTGPTVWQAERQRAVAGRTEACFKLGTHWRSCIEGLLLSGIRFENRIHVAITVPRLADVTSFASYPGCIPGYHVPLSSSCICTPSSHSIGSLLFTISWIYADDSPSTVRRRHGLRSLRLSVSLVVLPPQKSSKRVLCIVDASQIDWSDCPCNACASRLLLRDRQASASA